MTRPESRITPTLAAIERAWRLHPDWRLGQLISNLANPIGQDPFYIEDDRLVDQASMLTVRAIAMRGDS